MPEYPLRRCGTWCATRPAGTAGTWTVPFQLDPSLYIGRRDDTRIGKAVRTGLEGRSLQEGHTVKMVCGCGTFMDRRRPAMPSHGCVCVKSVRSIG